MGWSSKTQYKNLIGKLLSTSGRDFEKLSLELLKIIWPNVINVIPLKHLDKKGIDHVVWANDTTISTIVQCKGFETLENSLGKPQLLQCERSINSFLNSDITADRYILLFNRIGKESSFRNSIDKMLKPLVTSGKVKDAKFWNVHTLLNEVFTNMRNLVQKEIFTNAKENYLLYSDNLNYKPLKEVPTQISRLTINQFKLIKEAKLTENIIDPAKEFLKIKKDNLILIIGEAGFGKTTSALRATEYKEHEFIYIPAATYNPVRKEFFLQTLNIENILNKFEEEYREFVKNILTPAVESVFNSKDTKLVLIIDGLDESLYFTQRGGLQLLFNQFKKVQIPVILLARSEFWYSRIHDFSLSFGPIGNKPKNRRIKLIKLLPWNSHQIYEITLRYRNSLKNQNEKNRISKLLSTIENNTYIEFYGDIPTRPLFLKFILDSVAKNDISKVDKITLFKNWVYLKILRDIDAPMKWGNISREPIISNNESPDTTVQLSFYAMKIASSKMVKIINNVLELEPYCTLDEYLLSNPRLSSIQDPTGLFLNSLLVPVPQKSVPDSIKIRFAHRAYQEFFLALYIMENPDFIKNVKIPDEINDYLKS